MKKLIFCGLLFLAGCVTNQHQTALNTEFAAWEAAENAISQKCGNGMTIEEWRSTLSRTNAVDRRKCVGEVAASVVGPVAVYPDLFYEMEAKAVERAETFAAGKISKDKFWAESAAGVATYRQTVLDRINRQLAMDQQMATQRAQEWQAFQSTMPKSTSCYGNGAHVSCTTY